MITKPEVLPIAIGILLASLANPLASEQSLDTEATKQSSPSASPTEDAVFSLHRYRVCVPEDWKRVDGTPGKEPTRFEDAQKQQIVYLLSFESPDGKINTTYITTNETPRQRVLELLKETQPESIKNAGPGYEFLADFYNNPKGELVLNVSAEFAALKGVVLKILIRCPANTEADFLVDLVKSRLANIQVNDK